MAAELGPQWEAAGDPQVRFAYKYPFLSTDYRAFWRGDFFLVADKKNPHKLIMYGSDDPGFEGDEVKHTGFILKKLVEMPEYGNILCASEVPVYFTLHSFNKYSPLSGVVPVRRAE